MTYKTGSIGEFMKWTKSVVADPAAAGTPKRWFDSDVTTAKSLGAEVSAEAMVKLLSEQNLTLLHLIASGRFKSMSELATQTHRAASNLSRTLKKLHEAGIIGLDKGPGKSIVPRLAARRVTLNLDLVGTSSAVAVEPVHSDSKRPDTRINKAR
jgi:predicted transcriptional regulator